MKHFKTQHPYDTTDFTNITELTDTNYIPFYLEFLTPGAKPPDAPGPPPPLRGRGRGIEAPRPPGAGDFLSETPGDAGAILLHKLGNFLLLSHIFKSKYRNNTMFYALKFDFFLV